MPSTPQENDQAPDFTLKDAQGRAVSLKDYRGRKVVIYFYPEDDTPLCTRQACGLKEEYPVLTERNTVVLGISPDDGESHRHFAAKFDLPFPLLSDPDHAVMTAYGAWGEKNMYGNLFSGVKRITFLIDENGRIQKILRKVNTKTHSKDVLKYLG